MVQLNGTLRSFFSVVWPCR